MDVKPVEKLRAIASHMPGWVLETSNEWASYLRHTQTQTGLLVSHRGRERLSISVDWPLDFNGAVMLGRNWGVITPDEPEPSITVSLQRPVKALANDILRRIGNAAIPLHREAQKRRQERVYEADKAKALAEQVADILGVKTPGWNRRQRRYEIRLLVMLNPGYGRIEICDHSPIGTIEFNNIDAELMRKIAEVVAAHWQGRKPQ